MAFEGLTSWLSEMFAKGVSSITNLIDEALGYVKSVLPEVDIPRFVDTFREMQRDEQFASMITDPNVPQTTKDTEFIESADTFPRNYKVRLLIEYVDPDTGENEETFRSFYTDTRMPNAQLENTFAAQFISGSPNMPADVNFYSVDLVEHSKGSPYGPL